MRYLSLRAKPPCKRGEIMMIDNQETPHFSSEKYVEITSFIEKTDEKKVDQEKEPEHVPVLPYWRPYDLR
jgi:hypothetical protein